MPEGILLPVGAQGSSMPEMAPLHGGSVLIVDDERAIISLYKMLIEDSFSGLTVADASNGLQAVKIFEQFRFDAVLMDLFMPQMDGCCAAAEISRICTARNWAQPLIVFCTGFAPPNAVERMIAQNLRWRLLPKPLSESDFIGVLAEGLGIQPGGLS